MFFFFPTGAFACALSLFPLFPLFASGSLWISPSSSLCAEIMEDYIWGEIVLQSEDAIGADHFCSVHCVDFSHLTILTAGNWRKKQILLQS